MDVLDILSRESLFLAVHWKTLVVNDKTLSIRTRHVGIFLSNSMQVPKTNRQGDLLTLNVGLIAQEMIENPADVLQSLLELEDAGWLIIRGDVRYRPMYLLALKECVQ